MDGRIIIAAITFALPAALIGLTIVKFSSNPLSIMALVMVMIGGAFYLVTYEGAT